MSRLLMLRVGYMERYDGPAAITGGGAYVRTNGVGGEVFNFKPYRGRCFGYSMTTSGAGIKLNKLDPSQSWTADDELDDVDVVFFARRPGHGQVVVGWYSGATVYHRNYRVRRGHIPGIDFGPHVGGGPGLRYLCTAPSSQAYLLPEDERTFEVPSAPVNGKGYSGQSNVWYPDRQDEPYVVSYLKELRRYLTNAQRRLSPVGSPEDKPQPPKRKGRPDLDHNTAVEAAAVDAVRQDYEANGYTVVSVEEDNKGWDLEATKGRKTLLLEVKGRSAQDIYFELTPNEYAKLIKHSDSYRVCVVCDALEAPTVYDLKPVECDKEWRLICKQPSLFVSLTPRTAAVGREISADGD